MSEKSKYTIAGKREITILAVALSLLIIAAGYAYLDNEEDYVRRQKQTELKAIAQLKINQISGWFRDELVDASIIARDNYLIKNTKEFLGNPSEKSRTELQNILLQISLEHDYADVSIASRNGEILVSSQKNVIYTDSLLKAGIRQSSMRDTTAASDLYRSEASGHKIILSIASPVRYQSRSIAIIVYHIDAERYIFPLVRFWPGSSWSAETFIVRRENNSVLYLNNLRNRKVTALSFRLPLNRPDLPAVKAVTGYRGIFEGFDYRNKEIFAYLSSVPGTPWFLVAKIDKDEMLAGLYAKISVVVIVCMLIIMVSAAVLFVFYNFSQKQTYKELYNKEKELWQSQEKFKVTIDCLGEGVIIADVNGKIQYINRIAEEITGWSMEQAKDKLLDEVYLIKNEMTGDIEQNIKSKVLSHGVIKELADHAVLVSKTGREIPVVDSGAPLYDNDGTITGLVLTIRDETERKRIMTDLIAAKEKAEEINKVKSFFFATMSHELRTPFVGILGYAELLDSTLTDPEAREMVQGILNTSRRMKDTLTKILSLSKMEFDGLELNTRNTDVREIIELVLKEFSAAAEKKDLELITDISSEELIMRTDPTLLTEVLNNLVSNAIIYTDKGHVCISAHKSDNPEENLLILKVSDTGIGIEKQKQELIWEEFRQASEGYTRSYQGTGLGLAIVKKYIDLIDGKVTLESKPGEGSTFILRLPLAGHIP
ncbi:MAG: ATP-binding protein [Bacteroidota bacterium]